MPTLHCHLCNQPLTPFLDTADYFHTQEEFQLYQCPQCSLLETYPAPTKSTLSKYYDTDKYLSHSSNKFNLISLLYNFIRKISINKKVKLINQYSYGNKLLDFGCGTGQFLKAAKHDGWEVNGMEPNVQARRHAANEIGEYIYASSNEIKETYSVITLWHVLEHVYDPLATIKLLNEHLTEKGSIILALPNYKSPDASYYQNQWAGFDVPRHLFHFSQESVKQLAIQTGMKIEAVLPMTYDAYYVSLLSERYQRPNHFPYLRALRQGFRSNKQARQNNNYSSLIYVIKKDK